MGHAAPGATRGDPHATDGDPLHRAPGPRRHRRRDRRARGRGGGVPIPRSALAAPGHRPVPGRPPSRRPCRVPARARAPGRRARSRARPRTPSGRAADPRPRRRARAPTCAASLTRSIRMPGTCRRCRSSSSGATGMSTPSSRCSSASGSSRSSVPVASARPRSRSRPRAQWSTTNPAAPSGAWLARLEAAATADEVHDVLIAAFNVTGGDGVLFERIRALAGVLVLDNCEHVVEAAARSRRGCSTPRPGCGSSAPARSPSTSSASRPLRARAAATHRCHRAVHPTCDRPASEPSAARRRRGPRALPLARRSPARDRAGRGAGQDAAHRRDHPPPRRPLRGPAGPDEHQTPTPASAQGNDRVELRPPVPRRQARVVGAGNVRGRRIAPRRRVRPRNGTRRPGVSGHRRDRKTGGPISGHHRRRERRVHVPLPPPRQHPRLRARSGHRSRADRAGIGSTRAVVRRRGRGDDRRSAEPPPGPAPRRRSDGARRTSTPRWRGAQHTIRNSPSTS